MTKEDVEKYFLSKGWNKDRYGHLQKENTTTKGDTRQYRIKFQAKSFRYEIKVNHEASEYSPASSTWVRLRSGYYKQVSINAQGVLAGMTR